MQVMTTFRHMEQSEALKAYVEEKLERVNKYIDEPISAQVYFSVEKIPPYCGNRDHRPRHNHQSFGSHQRHVCRRGYGTGQD